MSRKKAVGVDQVTKDEYGDNLGENLDVLIDRMKRQAYKPQPVKRVFIPKAGTSKMRPLGILAYEDKLVQKVLSDILNAVFEEDFLADVEAQMGKYKKELDNEQYKKI